MVLFTYKARNKDGQVVNGLIEADNETQAANRIEQLTLSPVAITVKSGVEYYKDVFAGSRTGISQQEIQVFTRQLATLVGTGIPLIQSLENVSNQTNNKRFKSSLMEIISLLRNGASLSVSLSRYPKIFSNLYISLVRVGETGGILDQVLKRLADLSTQEIDLRSRLRSALIYPAVLAGISFLIVNFVLIAVLPRFVTIFDASQAQLPLPTRILMLVSGFLSNYWWLLSIGTIFLIFGSYRFYHSTAGKVLVDHSVLKIPLFGPLILKVMVCQMARSIAALTKCGITVMEALTVVESTVSNVVIKKVIANVRTAISRGQNLTEPFQASGLFPPMVIQLIDTGERSGKLGEMFDEIANFYEPEIDYTVRNLTSLLEPVMLLGMGLVVAFIALSVLLPIFNLISIIRK